MPTYEYACKDCARHLEVVQSFADASLTTCPTCGGQLRKVFGAAGIIFKGSGYYVNDSRAKAKASTSSEGGAKESRSDGASADSGSKGSDAKGSDAKSNDAKSNGSKDGGKSGGSRQGKSEASGRKPSAPVEKSA